MRYMMKDASTECNVEDGRVKWEPLTREKHIIGQGSEPMLRDFETSLRNVRADKMTRRKVSMKKRDRVAHTAAEVEDSQVFIGITASQNLHVDIFYFILGEVGWIFSGDIDVLCMQRIVFVCKFVKLSSIH